MAATSSDRGSTSDPLTVDSPTLSDVKARFAARLPRAGTRTDWRRRGPRRSCNKLSKRTSPPIPPPTSLGGVRADLLMHVCKQLKRLVTERLKPR